MRRKRENVEYIILLCAHKEVCIAWKNCYTDNINLCIGWIAAFLGQKKIMVCIHTRARTWGGVRSIVVKKDGTKRAGHGTKVLYDR